MRRTFHLVPHTHWDREWYLARAGFETRLGPLVDDVLTLLEADPALRFHLDGQTVLVEDYLALAGVAGGGTRARERIAAQASSGRLGLGPWYVLADEQIPSGETLLRNLLLGMADARALGADPGVVYSPDAFGHPAILPTVGSLLGLRFGLVWRGLGPPVARGDLVRWRGPDGATMLVHHLPPAGYELGAELVGPAAGLGARWERVRQQVLERGRSTELLIPVGADHHAPDPDLGRLVTRIQRLEPDAEVRVSSLDEYFRAVEAADPAIDEIAGELRAFSGHTWSLQGVHGTRSRQKRRFGAAELLLQRLAEPLGTLAALAGGRSREPALRMAWRRLIRSAFHDSIAGTVADPVAREQDVRLESVLTASREIARASLAELVGHDYDAARDDPARREPALVLWNPTVRRRHGVVTAAVTWFRADVLVGPPGTRRPRTGSGYRPFHLVAADGMVVPVQVLGVRPGTERIDAPRHYPDLDQVDRVFVAFDASPVAGLATSYLEARPGLELARPRQPAWRRGRSIGNDRVTVRYGAAGRIGFTDRERGVELRSLIEIEAEADDGDTYTPAIRSRSRRRAAPATVEPMADGPLVSGVAQRWRIAAPTGRVDGRTAAVLHADSELVRLRIDLETRATGLRIRGRFRLGIGGDALVGTPFGQARRAPVRFAPADHPTEWPTRTAGGQRFVAVANDEMGFAVLAPGPFEYEWTSDGDLLITLVRSIGELSKPDLVERPGHAGWPMPTPEAEEPGHHRIDLAFAAIDDRALARPADLIRAWENAFLPLQAAWYRDYVGRSEPVPGIELIGDDLSFEAIKTTDDGVGLVLRALDRSGRGGRGRWRFDRAVARAMKVRADESGAEGLTVGAAGREVRFEYRPAELVTIRIEFEAA